METLLPLLLWHAFCTAKHFVKVYYLYGTLPPGPVTMWRYTKARLG